MSLPAAANDASPLSFYQLTHDALDQNNKPRLHPKMLRPPTSIPTKSDFVRDTIALEISQLYYVVLDTVTYLLTEGKHEPDAASHKEDTSIENEWDGEDRVLTLDVKTFSDVSVDFMYMHLRKLGYVCKVERTRDSTKIASLSVWFNTSQ